MHHTMDVTLRGEANQTVERTVAENLNVIRKQVLSMLRHVDVGKKASGRTKSYIVSLNPRPTLEMLTHS